MGKKKGGDNAEAAAAAEKAKAEEAAAEKAKAEKAKAEGNKGEEDEEDTPTIKQLKEIDDKYCASQVELEREIEKLRKQFTERQAPLLAERLAVLSDATGAPAEAAALGTPACAEFWLQALQNCPDTSQLVEKWDEQILHYLQDIQKIDTDTEVPLKGFRLVFTFRENPFFTNTTLTAEFITDYDLATYKPYKEEECIEFKATPIEWKAGKNITVEKVKQESGNKKGKRKPAKAKEEVRPSLFRILFTSVKLDEPLEDGLRKCIMGGDDEEDDDEDEMVEEHLSNLYEVGRMLGEQLIPYAVRYYTGEACDDDDDDDDEDEEEEEEDDDDDDDDDDDEDEPPKKPAGKGQAKKGKEMKCGGAEPGQKQEECKQQ